MKYKITTLAITVSILSTSCRSYFDNSDYYLPSFSPNPKDLPVCPHEDVLVNSEIGWIIVVNGPEGVKGCGPRKEAYIAIASGKSLRPAWRGWDGGFGAAGTNYSMRALFPEDREREHLRRQPSPDSQYFSPDHIEDLGVVHSNGIRWEHSLVREFTKYPPPDNLGPDRAPVAPRMQRLRDIYIHKHPEGWWLRVQANFNPEMENYPDILASRRDTLRQVVESIRIEPKDPSRVTCRTDDRGRESCRYRWP